MLKSRNYLDWMNDLGSRLNLKDISTQFISVAVAMDALVESICEMANKEVSETPTSTYLFVLTQIPEIPFLTALRPRLSSSAQHTLPRQHSPDQGMCHKLVLRLARVPDRQQNPDN